MCFNLFLHLYLSIRLLNVFMFSSFEFLLLILMEVKFLKFTICYTVSQTDYSYSHSSLSRRSFISFILLLYHYSSEEVLPFGWPVLSSLRIHSSLSLGSGNRTFGMGPSGNNCGDPCFCGTVWLVRVLIVLPDSCNLVFIAYEEPL